MFFTIIVWFCIIVGAMQLFVIWGGKHLAKQQAENDAKEAAKRVAWARIYAGTETLDDLKLCLSADLTSATS